MKKTITKTELELNIIDSLYNDNIKLNQIKLWLLFNGDLNLKTDSQWTILHSLSKNGQKDIISYIIDKNIIIDILDYYKATPLLYASCNGHLEVVNLLLNKKANINHQNQWSWSALHFASAHNHIEIVKLLFNKKANIYLKTNKNETALDIAKRLNYQQIIDYLDPLYK